MVHAGVIDRKALKEYKRLNREKLGLSETYDLPVDTKSDYLSSVNEWSNQEQNRLTAFTSDTAANVYIPPLIQFQGNLLIDENENFQSFQDFLNKHPHCMLLGNGGSGKTFFLLNWLRHQCEIAQKDIDVPIPVFVPLHRLTKNSTLLALIRAALAKHSANFSNQQVEALLSFGRICVVLDGLNEISFRTLDDGAYNDILNFLDSYPNSYFIISSRYISSITEWQLPKLEMEVWSDDYIKRYLTARLGPNLGEQTYTSIGDNLDFEWLSGCSVAGLYSNPLTLWMITAVIEENQKLPADKEDIVDTLVTLSIERSKKQQIISIIPRLMRQALEDFAYFMIEQGEILSTTYDTAIGICARILKEMQATELLPSKIDAYQLLSQLLQTGLLRQPTDKTIEWLHQIIQEKLSVNSSDSRFGEAIRLASLPKCPNCGYRADDYFEQDGFLYGTCNVTENCSTFEVNLPDFISTDLLRKKLVFIDHTGAPREQGMTSIPNSFVDERWLAIMPVAGMTYYLSLTYSQDSQTDVVSKAKFLRTVNASKLLVNLGIHVLTQIGMLRLECKGDTCYVHVFEPPVNPSLRLVGYDLITLRFLSDEELEEEEQGERFSITSKEKEKYLEERRRKNLPIYHRSTFIEQDKQKVFRIAQKFGGQIVRAWGPYEEVVAEFPGEAWNFEGYSSE